MAFGLTEEGLVVPRHPDILDGIFARLRGLFSTTIDLSDKAVEVQFSAIVSDNLTLIWELLEVFKGSINADEASGVLLDAICLLTGTFRRPPSFSVVTMSLTGDPTTLVPGGTLVSVGNESAQFATVGDGTITAVSAWVAATAYVVLDRVTHDDRVYECITAGTSHASIGPTDETDDVTDGTVHWTFIGAGTGVVDKTARCVVTGPVFAPARSIIVIDTPVGGLDSVINLLDVVSGANQQQDEDLRLTREAELAALGGSPADALRGHLLRVGFGTVNPVTAATVFHNVTDVTDADGVLPHTVEALVSGGVDADIFAELWRRVAGGIRTQGTTTGSIVDSQGRTQPVAFSRPEELEIYVDVTLEKDPETYPADGDDQVKAAIVAYGIAQQTGKDVVASRISAAVFTIPGVLDVSAVLIDDAPAPVTSTTIPISLRQIAVFDTSRIDVTATDGVP